MRSTALLSLATLLLVTPASAAVPHDPPAGALVANAVLVCFAGTAASSPRSVTIEHLDVAGDVVYGATYEVPEGQARRAATDETSVSCRFTSRGSSRQTQGSAVYEDWAETTVSAE